MSNKIKTSGAASPTEETSEVEITVSAGEDTVKLGSFLETLFAKEEPEEKQPSTQGVMLGQRAHPFNFKTAALYQTVDAHHSRAIRTKVSATVGLGFQTPNDRKRLEAKMTGAILKPSDLPPEGDIAKIDTVLGPLCDFSLQDLMNDLGEDFETTGNGFIEVRRNEAGVIRGLYHIPAKEALVVVENQFYDRHYLIQSEEDATGIRLFSKFNDRDDFLTRIKAGAGVFDYAALVSTKRNDVSEVIHIRMPSSLSRFYGFPDWLAAVTSIELVQCLTQHEYDFFQNRGVPDFMLFLSGAGLVKKDKDKIKTAMEATIGKGNQHKSILVTINNPETKIQLEKLAMESKSDGSQFAGMAESLALKIVSAHGVPPLLAGIQVPGKLGASNEMIQAMQAFQTLVIEPRQRLIRQALVRTLGMEAALGLVPGDFVLNKITDAFDLETADTAARMKQSPQEAAAEGRNLKDGVKKFLSVEQGALVGALLNSAMEEQIEKARGR